MGAWTMVDDDIVQRLGHGQVLRRRVGAVPQNDPLRPGCTRPLGRVPAIALNLGSGCIEDEAGLVCR